MQSELLASYTWPVSTEIASPGAVTIDQELTFYKPVYVGDTITVVGEVTRKVLEKKYVYVRTTVYNQNDELVVQGEAEILAPRKQQTVELVSPPNFVAS